MDPAVAVEAPKARRSRPQKLSHTNGIESSRRTPEPCLLYYQTYSVQLALSIYRQGSALAVIMQRCTFTQPTFYIAE